MSIHMFFGAPLLSRAPSILSKKENGSLANEKPWRELQLSFTNDTFNLCSTDSKSLGHETADDAIWVVNSKDQFPVNFGKRVGSADVFMTDCATSVGCVKSSGNKKKVLCESPDPGCSAGCDITANQKRHHVFQKSKKDSIEGCASYMIHNHLDTSPSDFKVKDLKKCVVDHHNQSDLQGEPQGENLVLKQFLKRSSQKANESKPGSLLDEPSGENLFLMQYLKRCSQKADESKPGSLLDEPKGENLFLMQYLKRCSQKANESKPGSLLDEPQGENLFLKQYLKRCSQKADESKPGSLLDEPQGENLFLKQYLKRCSQKADESKPGNLLDEPQGENLFLKQYLKRCSQKADESKPGSLLDEPQGENLFLKQYLKRCSQKANESKPGSLLDEPQDENLFLKQYLKRCSQKADESKPGNLLDEPQGENLVLKQYLKSCSQKVNESKPGSLLDAPSNLDISTDNEFLSVPTLSHVSLCSGQYAVEQNEMQNKPIAGEGIELALPGKEERTDGEPLFELHEDGDMAAKKVDINCEANSDCSIELFDSDNSSQDPSDFEGSCPLSSSLNNEGQDLKSQQKRPLGSPEDHHAERSQVSEAQVTTTCFTFGYQQLSKRIKLARSPVRLVKKNGKKLFPGIGKAQKQLSLLKNCVEKSRKYSVLVVVLHPCHIKEIKTGSNSSSQVPLATIVVADQSEVRQKIVLWRAAAFLSLTVFPGDIILCTDVVVCENRWVGEMMLQSTFTTKLVNLGSCSAIDQKEVSHIVDSHHLQDLLAYVSAKHAPLQTVPPRQRQSLDHVPHVLLNQLKPDILVHAILRIINITVLMESVYSFKEEKERKLVLTVEQIKGQPYALVVWGGAAARCLQLQRKKAHIWEFKYLFVKHHPVSGDLELHTTPWSVLECLFDDDKRAVAFQEKFGRNVRELVKTTTLASHLEEKSSGIIEVKGWVSKLSFPDASSSYGQLVFHAGTSLEHIFASLPLITYQGCAKCGCELQTDDNGIYQQCPTCLPLNKVKIFYRPATMTVEDGDCEISAQVGSELMEKIFLNIPAEWLKKAVEASSDATYGMLVADLCHSLLTDAKASYLLTIKSHFVLDENSFPLEKDFRLLEFHLDL